MLEFGPQTRCLSLITFVCVVVIFYHMPKLLGVGSEGTAARVEHDSLTAADLKYEPEKGYFTGKVKVGDNAVDIRYRRLKEPIKITEDFRWNESTTRSALDTVLTQMSFTMRLAVKEIESVFSKDALASYYEDLDRFGSEEERMVRSKRLTIGVVVLGEIQCDEKVSVVVVRRVGEDYISYLGFWIVKENGRYLASPDIVLNHPLYETLAKDQYSLVTGFKRE